MTWPPCATCGERATASRNVSQEAAFLHDLLHGGGIYLVPPDRYVLPYCESHIAFTGETLDSRPGVVLAFPTQRQERPVYNLVEPDLVKYEVLETWTHASNDDRRVPCWGVTRNDGPRGNVFAWYNNQALAESVAIFLNNMRASEVSR